MGFPGITNNHTEKTSRDKSAVQHKNASLSIFTPHHHPFCCDWPIHVSGIVYESKSSLSQGSGCGWDCGSLNDHSHMLAE